MRPESHKLTAFASYRRELLAFAYRMLGDVARAEDMVQETWLRWQTYEGKPESDKAFLVTIVTRLCLNELDSAKMRREESRADRLPEPVDLEEGGMPQREQLEQDAQLEQLERISMAFLVVLQRLTPAERAVLLLHDVFDFDHGEVAALVGKSAAACRKLLERARSSLESGRRMLPARPEEHRRLLHAFLNAASAADARTLVELLADDAIMVADGGADGRIVGGIRNLPRPLHGAARIAAFVVAVTSRRGVTLQAFEHELNGQPAIVFWTEDRHPFAALLLAVAEGKIQRVFFHADVDRLRRLGPGLANG